jgi:subtilisin-like proprotein convertase family protein
MHARVLLDIGIRIGRNKGKGMRLSRVTRRGAGLALLCGAALAAPASAATFTNNTGITINDDFGPICALTAGMATPYPSQIVVSGQPASVTDVNVTITKFTHGFPVDVEMLLVGPQGQSAVLVDSAGDGTPATDVTFTLDDEASATIGAPLVAGTFKPTPNSGCGPSATTPFPAPAPAPPYGLALNAFDGSNPNGTWSLYVYDDQAGDDGDIEGWSLDISPTAAVSPYADEVLDGSPGGYWRFGEPSGTALLDSSPHANNGTYLGGVMLGAAGAIVGDPNTAASYDGVNDTGRVPDANSLDVGSSFTMEGWIKRSSTAKSQELFNKGQNGLQLTVMSAASGNKVWLRKAGVTTIAQSTVGVPADGAYHYVVATMNGNGTTAKIYVDGTDVTQVLPAGGVQSIANTTFPLTFGGAGSAQAFYDEFALYDEALPSCEIGDHYTTATGGPYIGC